LLTFGADGGGDFEGDDGVAGVDMFPAKGSGFFRPASCPEAVGTCLVISI
jgi:hypothetical protein